MRVDVIMPQMGESIAEGTLTKWLKMAGEKVARDEPIFEISTDKVDAEIPAPAAGTLVDIKVQEGQTVAINTVVAYIETEAGAAASAGAATAAAPAARPATAPPAAPASARPAPTAPAPSPAPAAAAHAPARPAAPIAAPLATGRVEFPRAAAMTASGASAEEIRRVRSSPVVRKMAQEHQLDIGRIAGTGVGGRVSKQDVLAAIASGVATMAVSGSAAPAPFPSAAAAPAYAPGERVSVVPMTAMRKKIAEHMIQSRRTSAHVTTVFEVDLHRTMQLRERARAAFEERHGVRLTVTPLMVRAAVEALKAFPVVNASLDGDNIVYKKDINVGVAVALDWGLIVPVIKRAEDLSLSGIAKAVNDLADRARNKKLAPDDVQGGTFTITNPGIFGSLFGTPIIPQPQVAIMGVGAIVKRVVVVDDAIAIHPVVYLALSFDHRLLDGAIADQFMAHIKKTLEGAEFPELG